MAQALVKTPRSSVLLPFPTAIASAAPCNISASNPTDSASGPANTSASAPTNASTGINTWDSVALDEKISNKEWHIEA